MSKVYRLLVLALVAAFVLSACAPAPAPAPAPAAPAKAEPTKAPEAPKAAEPTKAPAPKAAAEYHGAFPYSVPPKGHLNSFVTDGIPNGLSIYFDLLNLPGARYYWAENKWMPLAAEKWSLQPPDKFVLNLRKGIKWSDGKDFTAKDVVAT
ncbi:MAG: peptide/nickel transport system substrate-binding protein, partial [Chloroflexota bacterium]|nr:peptide/nickel transport system substrate-binding protein [Chloroflexota bacterium]